MTEERLKGMRATAERGLAQFRHEVVATWLLDCIDEIERLQKKVEKLQLVVECNQAVMRDVF